jgi:phosphohistidine swiveling domain-containing protein
LIHIPSLTKAETLSDLNSKLRLFVVPQLIFFNQSAYKDKPEYILENIVDTFSDKLVAVRSSAFGEDSASNSCAGEFDSFLNIKASDHDSLRSSINKVILSYKTRGSNISLDQVLVQEMVTNINMSGVIFTHDLNTGAPYYVINYDDQSGLTDTVTSGGGEHSNRTLYVYRNTVGKLRSERFTKLLQAVKELEQVMDSKYLDIEFALDANFTPYLLQARPITTIANWNKKSLERINTTLESVSLFVDNLLQVKPGVCGKTTALGQMPDWNPVEMIGRAPKALARTLYHELITNYAWSEARNCMGYFSPNEPLMLNLAGQPFIDTRLSFFSYIPRTVSLEVAEKLVNHWVQTLKENPDRHDKIEFDVAITTYSFDINERIDRLVGNVLNKHEKNQFKQAHIELARKIITRSSSGSIDDALKNIEKLQENQKESVCTKDLCPETFVLRLSKMIDSCINLGTIPFSVLARHGFIAKTILESLKHCGIITNTEIDKIHESVHTVARQYVDDVSLLKNGLLSKDEFMDEYGHLRPGTYDITSQRYDQVKGLYDGSTSFSHEYDKEQFALSDLQKRQINTLLQEAEFDNFYADDLLGYIKKSIAGREYGKFIFTRTVSNILELIADFAQMNGLDRSEISHVPLDRLLRIDKNVANVSIETFLKNISKQESEKHYTSVAIRLPQLITDELGAYIIPFQVSHPNFITSNTITASCVFLDMGIKDIILKDKIVIVKGADPGFDWIFSHNIAGLITKYGGSNSHMAIRCAEFNIPAAIGCGDQRFNKLLNSKHIQLDCAAGLINSIQ